MMYFHSSAARMVAPAVIGGSGLSSLSEPLIPKNDETLPEQEEEEAPIPLSSIGVIIGAVLLGAAGIAASAAAMVCAASMVAVYVAGGFGVLNSLTVVKNQYDISKGTGYRQGTNLLRREAYRLADEVDALSKAVKDLETEANLMKSFESQLSDIARKQGISVDKIVSLTRENEEILAKQKDNLKQTFLSDIAKAFITSEFLTGDMKVDMKSIPLLIMRLQIQLNSHGMQLNTEEFEAMVREDNDVGQVIKKCGEMLNSNDDKNSSFVTLTPEYSKGSLEVARGQKPTLQSKPKLEHRNTVVRDVKRGLSMKGIEVTSDLDSGVDSDYDSEADRLFGPRAGANVKPRSDRKHRAISNMVEKESKSKAPSKFKAAARISRFQADSKDENDNVSVSRGDARPVQQRGNSKGKFKAAAVLSSATRSSSKIRRTSEGGEAESHGSSLCGQDEVKSLISKRFSSNKLRSSITSQNSADESSIASKNSRAKSTGNLRSAPRTKKEGIRYSKSSGQLSALEKQANSSVRSRRRVREGSF